MGTTLALSIKQPWAGLILAGVKTIEVRRWPTGHRGRLLLHAGRRPDDRPDAWKHVTDEVRPLTEARGGVVGSVDVEDCVRYADAERFMMNAAEHLNEADWFAAPLYGFRLARPQRLPFVRCRGQVRLFPLGGLAEGL